MMSLRGATTSFWKKHRPTRLARTAALAALMLCLLIAYLLKILLPAASEPVFTAPFVHFTDAGDKTAQNVLLREQSVLFDSAPLFMPTVWNRASTPVESAPRQEQTELFADFPEIISLNGQSLQLAAKNEEKPSAEVKDALNREYWGFLRSFGEQSQTDIAKVERIGCVEIYDLRNNRLAQMGNLPADVLLPASPGVWAPVEFLAAANAGGMVGAPFLLQGSGVEGIDGVLRDYIERPQFANNLPPGYYKIIIGP